MSLSTSVGLIALFLVDLIDMYFLSLLGEIELASAVGYAGSILFFTTSICIGLSIASGALVSRSIGANKEDKAKRYLINILVLSLIITVTLALILWPMIPTLVGLLGAKGKTAEFAIAYLRIMIPSMPLMGIGMTSMAALRGVGDARRSMFGTLTSGIVNAALDPVFIFGLNMGVEGAAVASVLARTSMAAVTLYPLIKVHKMIIPFELRKLAADLKDFFSIALPAILTNISTPIGMAYVTASMAKFGDSAVAGMSVVGRLTPVSFAVVFALSGAVGPIIGQNFGAKDYGRVKRTIYDSLLFLSGYVFLVSAILFFIPDWISQVFTMTGDAKEIIATFCQFVAITYIFTGATYVGNAAFNNLGKAKNSTVVNLGKATIGTFPFVYFGAEWFDGPGVILGQAVGSIVFGIISIIWVLTFIKSFEKQNQQLA